jgi:hypothetical protein
VGRVGARRPPHAAEGRASVALSGRAAER